MSKCIICGDILDNFIVICPYCGDYNCYKCLIKYKKCRNCECDLTSQISNSLYTNMICPNCQQSNLTDTVKFRNCQYCFKNFCFIPDMKVPDDPLFYLWLKQFN